MDHLATDKSYLTADQRHLLGGWRDVADDIRQLCRSLDAVPDHCACGDGAAHLRGTCRCCQTPSSDHIPACEDCERLLAALRPRIEALTVDSRRFLPVVSDLLTARRREAGIAAVAYIANQVAAVGRTFEAIVLAAGVFRSGCRASHLKTLKEAAIGLLANADCLDRAL